MTLSSRLLEHGTTLDTRTRVEQRYNEFLRARRAQAAHDAARRLELTIPMGDVKCTSSLPCHHISGAILASREKAWNIFSNIGTGGMKVHVVRFAPDIPLTV